MSTKNQSEFQIDYAFIQEWVHLKRKIKNEDFNIFNFEETWEELKKINSNWKTVNYRGTTLWTRLQSFSPDNIVNYAPNDEYFISSSDLINFIVNQAIALADDELVRKFSTRVTRRSSSLFPSSSSSPIKTEIGPSPNKAFYKPSPQQNKSVILHSQDIETENLQENSSNLDIDFRSKSSLVPLSSVKEKQKLSTEIDCSEEEKHEIDKSELIADNIHPFDKFPVGSFVDIVTPLTGCYDPAIVIKPRIKQDPDGPRVIRVHYIGWPEKDDGDITDVSRVHPGFKYVRKIKVLVPLPNNEKFPCWPGIAYIRNPVPSLEQLGFEYLTSEKNVFVEIPCSSNNFLRNYCLGVWVQASSLLHFNRSFQAHTCPFFYWSSGKKSLQQCSQASSLEQYSQFKDFKDIFRNCFNHVFKDKDSIFHKLVFKGTFEQTLYSNLKNKKQPQHSTRNLSKSMPPINQNKETNNPSKESFSRSGEEFIGTSRPKRRAVQEALGLMDLEAIADNIFADQIYEAENKPLKKIKTSSSSSNRGNDSSQVISNNSNGNKKEKIKEIPETRIVETDKDNKFILQYHKKRNSSNDLVSNVIQGYYDHYNQIPNPDPNLIVNLITTSSYSSTSTASNTLVHSMKLNRSKSANSETDSNSSRDQLWSHILIN